MGDMGEEEKVPYFHVISQILRFLKNRKINLTRKIGVANIT